MYKTILKIKNGDILEVVHKNKDFRKYMDYKHDYVMYSHSEINDKTKNFKLIIDEDSTKNNCTLRIIEINCWYYFTVKNDNATNYK